MSHSSRRQYRLQTRDNALDTKKYYSSRKKKIISIQKSIDKHRDVIYLVNYLY